MKGKRLTVGALLLALMMMVVLAMGAATAESTGLVVDTNPAIAVAENTQNSVVGVITQDEGWDRNTGEETAEVIGQGSGVVIADGGYILTNFHVVDGGSAFEILLPSGERTKAELVGMDKTTDLAILRAENAAELTPVKVGSVKDLPVGSTVIAIGNPGGEMLANTVTSGVISALERDVKGVGSTRPISYIQHDAPISSGNSGGGLFDVNSQLIGINTLKYAGNAYMNMYSNQSYEGLGFAIPMDLAHSVALDLIEYGKVLRPAMGVTVGNWDGPPEAMNRFPPASVCVYSVTAGSPAAEAGMKTYDFITAIDGVRVTTLQELTKEMDKHQEGDTIEVTLVRYENTDLVRAMDPNAPQAGGEERQENEAEQANPYGGFFGNYPFGDYGGNPFERRTTGQSLGGFTEIKVNVTLEIIE